MSIYTSDICKAYAKLPKESLDQLWNDDCCAFVQPGGKCGQPEDGPTMCVVTTDFHNITISPHVGKNATLDHGMIGMGNFGGLQQCGDNQNLKQGTSTSSSIAGKMIKAAKDGDKDGTLNTSSTGIKIGLILLL